MVKVQEAGYSNVVYLISWLASDSDGTNVAQRGGEVEVPTPAGGTFIPYEQLTEPTVINWVKDVLGPEQVAAIEADLNIQILYMQQPPVTTPPLPWA